MLKRRSLFAGVAALPVVAALPAVAKQPRTFYIEIHVVERFYGSDHYVRHDGAGPWRKMFSLMRADIVPPLPADQATDLADDDRAFAREAR